MKLLVTGGAGFIGSNFVHYWREHHPDDQIVVLDALTYAGHRENLKDIPEGEQFKFIEGNIRDYETVKGAMKGIDAVVHFAAESHVDRSLASGGAAIFYLTNLIGTDLLLNVAKETGVKRFLHVSTDEVFGDLAYDDPEKFHEGYPYDPHSPYSVSKAAADMAVRAFYHTYHEPEILITNCSNNYGPYQTPEKVIPRQIALLQEGQKAKLYSPPGKPGQNVRDWIHVEDHCSALEAVLLKGKAGETYCIGGNAEMSNYELFEKMLAVMSELMGKPLSMEANVEFVADRPGHDRRYAMDTSKIERELGWKPKHTFEEGFRETVKWYMSPEGKEWLKEVKETAREVREGQDRGVEIQT
jgi:dTDP-glucose 4,6-dehydratase